MPKDTSIKKILVIGSGPIVIGQGCEFDYSGTQACKALREEGYEVVLVNSNPATIMTDPETAPRTYIEPITPEFVEKIIVREKPDALLPTLGGQTALNCAMELHRSGVLERENVRMIGAHADAIDRGEDRNLFKEAMIRIGLDVPRSGIAHTKEEARRVAGDIGTFPLIIRPAFTLGGMGGGVAYNKTEFEEICARGLDLSPVSEILIEESLIGWKEFEMEVMRDRADNCVVICSIENIDAMGVHTGDSITVAPIQTLTDREYQVMRDASFAVIREIGVETGGSNIQFAINPANGRMIVIEMNPRVSRSSALASKATGFPIAKLAAQVMAGKTLEELGFTREITPEYHCVKEAVFPWGRFPGIDVVLGPEMKSTGEVMGIDPDPDIAFAKSQISAFNPLPTEGKVFISVNDRDKERVLHMARQLADMGFTLCATRGTMIHLLQHDIECERAYKVNEARRPNIVDHIKNGDIDFIINTPGSHDARADDIIIRSSAIAAKTSYCTNLASAQACVNAIEALKNRNLQVCTIQEYHAQTV